MALKGNARKVYKTMRGKVVDMELLQQKNELTPAVGNSRVNARGDELGPGGKIIRRKEEVVKDYYEKNNRAASQPFVTKEKETSQAPEVTKPGVKSNTKTRAQQKVENAPSARELEELEGSDWVEDADGNFVPKGE